MHIGLQVAGFLWTCKHDQVYVHVKLYVYSALYVVYTVYIYVVYSALYVVCCLSSVLFLSQHSVLICV